MRLVKISDSFFGECKKRGTESELLYNENGRPSVLLVHLKSLNNQCYEKIDILIYPLILIIGHRLIS